MEEFIKIKKLIKFNKSDNPMSIEELWIIHEKNIPLVSISEKHIDIITKFILMKRIVFNKLDRRPTRFIK